MRSSVEAIRMRASWMDKAIIEFDKTLRALSGVGKSSRPAPGQFIPESDLSDREKRDAAAMMRINHSGEICAQALYQGQALVASRPEVRQALERSAVEEGDHLAWTKQRLAELGGRMSLLNPFWYGSSLAIGIMAGKAGDDWSLGFLAETERQVEAHLQRHFEKLPIADQRSRAILNAMRFDEMGHARTAMNLGARDLPEPVRSAMRLASGVMTRAAYWV